MADENKRNSDELPDISRSLEVERLDPMLFRSKSLIRPYRARGVFGGHVISQALVSATNCVDPVFSLHSLHCYFLLSASAEIPILYYVEKLRDGRSYVARSVKAVQNGRIIFMLLCSYQRPEPWQPSYQNPPPFDIPPPEDCDLLEKRFIDLANEPDTHPRRRAILLALAEERNKSNADIKAIRRSDGTYPPGLWGCFESARTEADGTKTHMWYMRAKALPPCEPHLQKCVLAYLSDLQFIGAAANNLGLERLNKGPNAVGMMSSLDHSVFFYDDSFDCGDWVLYVIRSPVSGSGRGVVEGRMYTRSGKLVAVMTQEGVVRADRKDPDSGVIAKL